MIVSDLTSEERYSIIIPARHSVFEQQVRPSGGIQMKKLWQTPELIVLVRGKPEEAVLTPCKTDSQPIGWENALNGCWYIPGGCGGCSVIAPS